MKMQPIKIWISKSAIEVFGCTPFELKDIGFVQPKPATHSSLSSPASRITNMKHVWSRSSASSLPLMIAASSKLIILRPSLATGSRSTLQLEFQRQWTTAECTSFTNHFRKSLATTCTFNPSSSMTGNSTTQQTLPCSSTSASSLATNPGRKTGKEALTPALTPSMPLQAESNDS